MKKSLVKAPLVYAVLDLKFAELPSLKNISDNQNNTIKADGGHFCEVEMLQMLGNTVEHKKGCGC